MSSHSNHKSVTPFFLFFFLLISATSPSLISGAEECAWDWSWVRPAEWEKSVFEDLSKKERKDRTEKARIMGDEARKMESPPRALDHLEKAVGLNPQEPLLWLQIGELLRRMGHTVAAEDALASGRALFKESKGQHRRDCILEYSLTMAWLEYERGNWSEGEAWGAKAKEAGAGLKGSLIEKLNIASRSLSQQEYNDHLFEFKPWNTPGSNRRADAIWGMFMWFHLHQVFWEEVPVSEYYYKNIMEADWNHTRWRDVGMICETHFKGNRTRLYYEKSARAIMGSNPGWLVRKERPLPGYPANMGEIPFWTNQEGGYVTGSLYAYADYLTELISTNPRSACAGTQAQRLLSVATACLQRYPDHPWVHYWRAFAYDVLGDRSEAMAEVLNARDEIAGADALEPALNALEGHLLVLRKKYGRAGPLLRQAVKDNPQDARGWGELGIVLAFENNLEEAQGTFEKSLALDPGQAQVWHNLSLLKVQRKQWQQALADMEKAAELAPEDLTIQNEMHQIKAQIALKGQ